jgi:hypothetical protein
LNKVLDSPRTRVACLRLLVEDGHVAPEQTVLGEVHRVREEADVPVPVTPSMISDTDIERRRPRQSAWLVLSPSAGAEDEADAEEGQEEDQCVTAAALNFRSESVDPSDAAKHEWTEHESDEAMYKREVRSAPQRRLNSATPTFVLRSALCGRARRSC